MAFSKVNWQAVHAFMRSLPAGKQQRCTKHTSEQYGVGTTLKSWNLQLDDLCPSCSSPENTTYVLQCITPDTTKVWNDMTKLTTFLYQSFTPKDLITATLSCLYTWRLQAPLDLNPSWSPTVNQVISNQDAISWKNLLEGLASTSWTNLCQRHTLLGVYGNPLVGGRHNF